jgi:hypothetical protein
VELDEALAARPLDSGVPVTAFAGHSMSDRTERARLLAGKLLNKVVPRVRRANRAPAIETTISQRLRSA